MKAKVPCAKFKHQFKQEGGRRQCRTVDLSTHTQEQWRVFLACEPTVLRWDTADRKTYPHVPLSLFSVPHYRG